MYGTKIRKGIVVAALGLALAACAKSNGLVTTPPVVGDNTQTHNELVNLPSPQQKLVVAVYEYEDQTGQFKPSDTVQSYSRAVTQGATSILVKALQDAGRGSWFTVVERERLDNLIKEREIIRTMRSNYATVTGQRAQPLPAMLFAGLILDGGIISYDSNTVTGGVGARYLGIGASTQYRQDTITIYLRAISTQTGEILRSVNVRKTIASFGVSADVFKFIDFQELLEGEAGFTTNEPTFIAIKQAIEAAVQALIYEGSDAGYWAFQDAAAGEAAKQAFFERQNTYLIADAKQGESE